jgi:transcriptional regulator with PAS, ATPase and Fis domain
MALRLVGTSTELREVDDEINCAARSAAKVLITGESGVGKDIVARLIHERSRRQGTFVTINCAGVPDSLLESELFGHTRGSFTGAYRDKRGWLDQAQGSTVFMDEVGEMSLRMQALLLRFLESGEIQRVGSDRVQTTTNVRVIAATNKNLIASVADKSFREDLYYRLNVIHIAIPPLRARRDDIVPLANYFLELFSESHRVTPPVVSAAATERLAAYNWPGNVRELRNVMERLVIRNNPGQILPADLPREISSGASRAAVAPGDQPRRSTVDLLYERIVNDGDSFWPVVHDPFMARDLTREDLRAIIARGLDQTRGSYKGLVQLFNVSADDYKRFLNFLRKYECRLPFQGFRARPATVSARRLNELAADYPPPVAADR